MELRQLDSIKKKYNLSERQMIEGLIFVDKIIEGVSTKRAYEIATREDNEAKAYNLKKKEYIMDIYEKRDIDKSIKYAGQREAIIRKGMRLVESRDSDIALKAMSMLTPYIGTGLEKKKDEEVEDTAKTLANILSNILEIGSNRKMISTNGEIIDVGILE